MNIPKRIKIFLSAIVLLSLIAGVVIGCLILEKEIHTNPCLKKAKSIKRGMTRAQVIKIFESEGCDSNIVYPSATQQNGCTEVFAYLDCPCAKGSVYKISIDFKPTHKFSSWMDLKANYKMRGQDKIVKISKPICEPLKTYH
jgi:uncharacterized protein YneF (UPF0154 family)